MTSIDNDLLKGIAGQPSATGQPVTIGHPVTGAAVDASLPASNEHLAWGYFLGDLAMQANGSIKDHANLGFWVAGQPVPFAVLQTLTGTATYGGGMIGTVVDATASTNRIATVVGQFAQQWNFTNRSGSLNASFDSANWNRVGLNMTGSTHIFTGTGSSSNIVDRSLAVQGSFFHNGTPTSANLPAAVGGLFAIHNSTGTYGANGVLVGARR